MGNVYYSTGRSSEINHYGVLGMKWGVHRARVNQQKANKIRKKNGSEKEARKYEDKAKAIRSKHESRSSKETVKRVENASVGKLAIQSALMGTYGALKYNQARSKGESRGRAALKGTLYNIGNMNTAGWLGVVEPRLSAKKKKG